MTDADIKNWVNHPPKGMDQFAFQVRQAVGARQQAEAKATGLQAQIKALQSQLEVSVAEVNRARGYEAAMLDGVKTLASITVLGDDRGAGGSSEHCGCKKQAADTPDGEVRETESS